MLIELALILFSTKTLGLVARSMRQPEVLGSVAAGLLIGPSLLGWLKTESLVMELGTIGVLILMFIAGLETNIGEIRQTGKASISSALGGIAIPLLGGYVIGQVFNYSFFQSLFIGTLLTATSVSISAQTLTELKQMNSKQGITIMSAAIIDDILGILLLTVVVTFSQGESVTAILIVIAKVAGFALLVLPIGYRLIPNMVSYVSKLPMREALLTLVFVLLFVMAIIAEQAGIASVTGAYLLGVFLSQSPLKHRILYRIEIIGYAFFVPLFFASIGLRADVGVLTGGINFIAAFLLVAILGKLLGCFIGAKVGTLPSRHALQIAIGMIPRAEVALIIAALGLKIELIDQQVFSATVLMVIATTVITPLLLRWCFGMPRAQKTTGILKR